MELKQIKENIYYIPNVTNIGVILDESAAVLIDSGLDDDAGKKILKCLEREGISTKAIINTHSHADHFGGNALIKARTGATIFSPEIEESIIRFPYFEPYYLFSGAHPINDLLSKFLMAPKSEVDVIIETGCGKLKAGNLEFDAVALPGHSPNQTGFGINGVLFCGDAIFSEELLVKHKLPFCMNVEKQLESLKKLKESGYEVFLPSHGSPLADINSTADTYFKRINSIREHSLNILSTGKTTAEYLQGLCSALDIEMRDARQYYLNNAIAMAYLSWLYNSGDIACEIKENVLYWTRNS